MAYNADTTATDLNTAVADGLTISSTETIPTIALTSSITHPDHASPFATLPGFEFKYPFLSTDQ